MTDLFTKLDRAPRKTHDALARSIMKTWTSHVDIDASCKSESDFDARLDTALQQCAVPTVVSPPYMVLLYEIAGVVIQSISDKGLGLVATKDIPRGSLVIHEQGAMGSSDQLAATVLLTGLDLAALAGDPLQVPHSWCPFPQYSLEAWNRAHLQVAANHFYVDPVNTPTLLALYPRTSRINHHCRANCCWFIHSRDRQMRVFAMKDIEAGTELSILYSPDEGHDASAPFQCDCNLSPSQRNTVSRISSTHAQSLADKAE